MKRELTVLYGQRPELSTSFQTRELTRHLANYFSVRPLELPAEAKLTRLFKNYLLPLVQRPKADLLLYGNDGFADLRHWRAERLLYWYDAPQDWSIRPPASFKDKLRCENIRAADHVFAVSAAQVRVAKALRPGRENSVHYLPVGVDCEFFNPASVDRNAARDRLSFTPETTVIGYLGYVGHWQHRFAGETLLEAAPNLKSAKVSYLVVGSGPALPLWKAKIKELGLQDRFNFTGYIPTTELPAAIAAMDICIDTLEPGFHSEARSETKLKQYMAMGRACVATDIGENRVDLDAGRAGVLVGVNPSSLAEGILRLVSDPAEGARLGAAARDRAVKHYAWPVLARRLASALGVA
jgi:glycosyltransferase involved in cell wall biosynthesis